MVYVFNLIVIILEEYLFYGYKLINIRDDNDLICWLGLNRGYLDSD